jgi:hypothetical protein
VTLSVALLILADADQSPWATTALSGLVIAAAAARAWPSVHLPSLQLSLALPSAVVMVAAVMSWLVNGGSAVLATNIVLAPVVALSVASLVRDKSSRLVVVTFLTIVLGVIGAAALVKWHLGDDAGGALVAGSSQSLRYSIRLFGHPNAFGMALAMLIPFAAAGVFYLRQTLLFLVSLASLTGGLAALILTQSRTAWVACVLGLLVVAPNWRLRAILTTLVLAGAALLAPQIIDRLAAEDYRENVRASIWRVSLDVVLNHPLLGVGPGNFSDHAAPVAFVDQPQPIPPPHAHNEVLNYAAEIGLPAAFAVIVLVGVVVASLVRARPHDSPTAVYVRRACLGALTVMVVAGQFDATIGQGYTFLIAIVVLGLSVQATRCSNVGTMAPVTTRTPRAGHTARRQR